MMMPIRPSSHALSDLPSVTPRRNRLGALLAALLLPLAACSAQSPQGPQFSQAPSPAYSAPWNQGAGGPDSHAKVGLLLPLSGGNALLGDAMMNSAQLALFDQGDPSVQLLPRDTASNAAGAAQAARTAIADGAKVLVGPLTAGETAAVTQVARPDHVPVLSFTNDGMQSGPDTWVLGVTPGEQARRVLEAAEKAGAHRFGLLAQQNEFGQRLAQAMQEWATSQGLPAPIIMMHPAGVDVAQAARELDLRARNAGGPLDAVLIGEIGASVRPAAAALAALSPAPKLLGHALWANDPSLAQEPALAGAWFPGPDPSTHSQFEGRYQSAFGNRPPRLAGVAYDGTALAARAARSGGTLPIGEAFQGADGPIRMLSSGRLAHGLAILAITPGSEPVMVQPAPVPGGGAGS